MRRSGTSTGGATGCRPPDGWGEAVCGNGGRNDSSRQAGIGSICTSVKCRFYCYSATQGFQHGKVQSPVGPGSLRSPAREHHPDRLRQGALLHLEDARGERVHVVAGADRHAPLEDRLAVVVLVVHEVNSAAGLLHSCSQDGGVHAVAVVALAAEGREQRGVDVDHAPAPVRWDPQEAQEAGEHGERDAALVELREDARGEAGRSAELLVGEHHRGEAEALAALERADPRAVADHERELGRELAARDHLVQVLERAPAARGEQREPGARLCGALHASPSATRAAAVSSSAGTSARSKSSRAGASTVAAETTPLTSAGPVFASVMATSASTARPACPAAGSGAARSGTATLAPRRASMTRSAGVSSAGPSVQAAIASTAGMPRAPARSRAAARRPAWWRWVRSGKSGPSRLGPRPRSGVAPLKLRWSRRTPRDGTRGGGVPSALPAEVCTHASAPAAAASHTGMARTQGLAGSSSRGSSETSSSSQTGSAPS